MTDAKREQLECEGDCTEHRGRVREVIVTGHGWDPLDFFYCDEAVSVDRERGFTVRETPNDQE